ncbi:MAG TPA: hypothetical protein VNQ76_13440 [Planctomicrobium sp.]|nr:hypothetical protein [Planctomicrobium sp.]
MVKVTGIVTVQGKPATEVVVIFVSESDTQEVRGWTNPDGRFSLMYRNDAAGAVPGRYQVRFASGSADSNIIPEKYSASNSGIPVEITREGPNDFKFDL